MKTDSAQTVERLNRYHLATMKFHMTDRIMKRYLERRVSGTGLYRGQHQMLMQLSFAPDISQTGLAERMEISPAAVTVALRKLEQGGYVKRTSRKEDNRSYRIEITPKGRRIVDVSIEIFHELERVLYQDFTMEETQQLCGYLERMHTNLEQYESKQKTIPDMTGWNGGEA